MRRFAAALLALSIAVTAPAAAPSPSDVADAAKVLAGVGGDHDFRVRIGAAIRLGDSGNPNARPPLELALDDPHPNVRQVAASALAKLGDAAAIPALSTRIAKESNAPTKSAMGNAIAALRTSPSVLVRAGAAVGAPDFSKTKYLVRLNRVKTTGGARGEALANVLQRSARAKLGAVPGVYLLPDDVPETMTLTAAMTKGVPVLGVDAGLVQMNEDAAPGEVKVQARVSLTITRLQVVKASIEGKASTVGASPSEMTAASLAKLEEMAVDGAVMSAMTRAPQAFRQAIGG